MNEKTCELKCEIIDYLLSNNYIHDEDISEVDRELSGITGLFLTEMEWTDFVRGVFDQEDPFLYEAYQLFDDIRNNGW